jgi:type IV pilus assembly protein PilA
MKPKLKRTLVVASLGVAFVSVVAWFAAPKLFESRMAANEASAVGSLRTLNTSLVAYSATYTDSVGYPPTLQTLGPPPDRLSNSCSKANLIDDILSSGMKSGYIFEYLPGPQTRAMVAGCPAVSKSYVLTARPKEYDTTGNRSFYSDESGVIRYSTSERPAVASDPILQ